jgi:hypothetical protein
VVLKPAPVQNQGLQMALKKKAKVLNRLLRGQVMAVMLRQQAQVLQAQLLEEAHRHHLFNLKPKGLIYGN